MNKTMRLVNATLLALFAIGSISNALLGKDNPLDVSRLLGQVLGLVIWFVTLGTAYRSAGAGATERTRNIAWRSNLWMLVLMGLAAVAMLFVSKQPSAAALMSIVCVPLALNVYWLRKMRREAEEEAAYEPATAFAKPQQPAAPPAVEPEGGNYFLRHWRGQLSLPVSYWINGSLLGLGLFVLFAIVSEVTKDLELRRVAAIALVMLATVILVTLWSLVGIWRSAGNHVARGGSAGWARAAQVMTILGIVSFSVRLVTELGPQMKEYAAIASGRDDLGIVKATISLDGQSLLLHGALGTGSTAEVLEILSAAPGVRSVMLNSHGGRLREAEQLAKLVRERGLDTYVEAQCLSACTYVFLAGSDRAATPNAKIGFHQPSFPGMRAETAGLQDMLEVYRAAGISEQFLAKVRATPSSSMWYPTRDELIDNGVINRVSLGGEAASWGTLFRSRRELTLAFREVPLIAAIDERFPGTVERAVEAAWQRREQGAVDAEITAELRGVISSVYPRLLATADDEGLDGFLEIFIEQITAARQLSDEACGLFLDARLSGANTMPRELIDRETQWGLEQLKSTSSQGRPVAAEAFESALQAVFANLTAEQIQVISDPGSYAREPATRCDAFAAFYEQVSILPDRERSIVMRGMYQSPELQ